MEGSSPSTRSASRTAFTPDDGARAGLPVLDRLAAHVGTSAKLTAGDSTMLFETRVASGVSTQQAGSDVSPDGRRFLVELPDARAIPTQINVVLNWFEELRAKLPRP